MKCETVRMPGGGVAIVCHRGPRRPRCRCGRPATRQCDFPTAPGKTCDKYLCAGCAMRQGRNHDYCPDHAAQTELAL